MRIKAFIAGVAGTTLSEAEKSFFRANMPWGFILFGRNVADPQQVLALTDELRALSGREDVPILIDQEGGRVARLRPPHWPSYPPGKVLGDIYRRNADAGLRAAYLQSRLMAMDLRRVGINVDCLPVLDVPVEGAHDVIGNRAYSYQPYEVAQVARAACEGLLAGGVLPVIKHIPGHGRAFADSHKELPVVSTHPAILGCTDFYPFMQLADMPMAMTAHVVYSGFDPHNPATTSPVMIQRIIRGWLGYDGLLMSDDLSMQALARRFCRTRACLLCGRLRCRASLQRRHGRDGSGCRGLPGAFGRTGAACPAGDDLACGARPKRRGGAAGRIRRPDDGGRVMRGVSK